MLAAHSLITERVRERVRAERLDLSADPTVAERLVRDELRDYAERSLAGTLPSLGDEQAALGRVLADLTGYGLCSRTSTTPPSKKSGSTPPTPSSSRARA